MSDTATTAAADTKSESSSADDTSKASRNENDRPAAQQTNSFTPPASQEELNELVENRLARERSRIAKQYGMSADDAKAARARIEALENDLASDSEKAVKAARDEERANARKQFVPRVVKAEFKAAAKGVLTGDQLAALLEDRDLSNYVDDDGEPDEKKIAALIEKFTPPKTEDKRDFPDLGGGNRGSNHQPKSMNDLIRQAAGRSG